jgi:hypothetical protein
MELLAVLLLQAAGGAAVPGQFQLPSGVAVRIIEAPFKLKNSRVEACGPGAPACLINGHVPFGAAFGVPHTYVKSITVEYEGQTHELDTSDMYDAWGRRPLEYKGVIRYFGGRCTDAHNCRFRGLFSDAAGAFVAEWLVLNDRAVRTVLTDSNDVVHLFMTNIDPPEFE